MSHIYTLNELVDLALRNPEIGAVNFNILRIILLKMISAMKLGNETAQWKPVQINTAIGPFIDNEEYTDHPTVYRLRLDEKRKHERQHAGGEESEEEVTELTKFESTLFDKAKDSPTRDTGVMTTDTETTSVSEESDEKDISEPRITVKKYPTKKVPERALDMSKGLQASKDLWQIWQTKKLIKRIEAVEEELNKLVDAVDSITELANSRFKAIMFDEGERRQRKGDDQIVDRVEFEDTIDDLGEAISRVVIKQRQQKEEFDDMNDSILKELSNKISIAELEKETGQINKKLRILAVALKNIQSLIKEIIFPEACGTTRCISCGRKAQLVHRYILKNSYQNISKKKTSKDKSTFQRTEKCKGENLRTAMDEDQKKYFSNKDNKLSRSLSPEDLVSTEPLYRDTDM